MEIILVEDNPSDVEITIRALKKIIWTTNSSLVKMVKRRWTIFFVKGSIQGRNTDAKPKLILLDLKMPQVDGIKVLRNLKVMDGLKQFLSTHVLQGGSRYTVFVINLT